MKPAFSIIKTEDRSYGSLVVKLYHDLEDYSNRYATITFQSTLREGRDWDYYGGRVGLEDCETMTELDQVAKILKRIFRETEPGRSFCFRDVEAVLGVLLASKLPQVVYDDRVSQYVPVSDLKPEGWRAWRDDYDRYASGGSCHASAIAPDAEEARRLLTVSFAEKRGWSDDSKAKALEAWLAAGRPVKDIGRNGPTVTLLAPLLEWIKGERIKAAKALAETEQAQFEATRRAALAAEQDAIDANLETVAA